MSVQDRLSTFLDRVPVVAESAYIAPTATLVGDVRIGDDSSIWYGSVLRGDINYISIGKASNL